MKILNDQEMKNIAGGADPASELGKLNGPIHANSVALMNASSESPIGIVADF
ncbi:MAG: bacteriocin [Alphaproteobacteria bacterium]|nr:bacteriocin [Alphaproteobacteria bacterium]